MTQRQRKARLETIRKLVEGEDPAPAVMDTYQASDEDALEMAQKPNMEAGGAWVAHKRGQIDPTPWRE